MSRKTQLLAKNVTISLTQARKQTQRFPNDSAAWIQLGAVLSQRNEQDKACLALEKAVALAPNSHEALVRLADVELLQHKPLQALEKLELAREILPDSVIGWVITAKVYLELARVDKAVECAQSAAQLEPNNLQVLDVLSRALSASYRYDEAIDALDQLIKMDPHNFSHWNNAGNLRRDLGLIEESYRFYRRAAEINANSAIAYSNHLTAMHYDPMASREEIAKLAHGWEQRYAPSHVPPRPVPADRQPNKRLRVGMLSDGLRNHPVGKMIVRCLESLDPAQIELYAYTSSAMADNITDRIKKMTSAWQSIRHMSDDDLASQFREDKIDILIDLSGHNAGTRMRVMAMQPAPLLVKWVGGLINTTGVKAIDYLMSDHIETPVGEDEFYTEQLIRLPDDYIVFDPPVKRPEIAELPANRNGFITLACFNNPTKINSVTLARWAAIMHDLPNSKLLLKGRPYTSETFCERLYSAMEAEGIERDRLIIEGPGGNYELLEAYNRADIALDPWPYSGGLTTCEAFLMGVPVITMPGPTFAGRHSASHLVHAGMPELVTHSWEEYHARVLELASDLESLAIIRRSLRQVLLQSPVCNGPRFAKHFTQAMRAIWQRYCEEKAPEALTFSTSGEFWFEDDKKLLDIHVEERPAAKTDEFQWELKGKLVVMDNSAKLIKTGAAIKLSKLNAFTILVFDPASTLQDPSAYDEHEHIQLFQHALLGDGQPTKLNACLDPALSSTLTPLRENQLPEHRRKGAKVLAQLPINTVALDNIEGLPSLDWFILDELSDAVAILEHGHNKLKDTLLIQARVAFQPTHERQPSLVELQHWASRNGFRFYCFINEQHHSYLPEKVSKEKRLATELQSADAIFLPNFARMEELTENQSIKLAFLLYTVYGIKDLPFTLLKQVDEEKAENYLMAEGMVGIRAPTVTSANDNNGLPTKDTQSFPVPDAPFMSSAERDLFLKSIKRAKHYFEFGSGGSTVWAVREGLLVKGVESDAKWVNALKDKLGEKCQIEAVDIGPTQQWGFPVSMQQAPEFSTYSNAIHHHDQEFDLILVDGRFRVACTMATIQHILEYSTEPQEARIFIHDFWNRPQYHVVLPFLEAVEKVESAGLFKVAQNVSKEDVATLWEEYKAQPQ
ncbi:tetratricopeptide repeat protein [Vreelandella neptunia]|uniref:protein O-GlcNAc transferase n=1 Tax=Vreelandella neptunia TaxID=115551 RepID=A0ABS9S6D0_9GAMM|nr:tetratricopeptide repeat protein [Halomonas neptunia]MCH4811649.1 hypothetical protein [Halomonas neptunia]